MHGVGHGVPGEYLSIPQRDCMFSQQWRFERNIMSDKVSFQQHRIKKIKHYSLLMNTSETHTKKKQLTKYMNIIRFY